MKMFWKILYLWKRKIEKRDHIDCQRVWVDVSVCPREGSRVKRRKVRDLIHLNSLDSVSIQETKLLLVYDSLVHYVRGNLLCEWNFIPLEGNSGGLISIWCSAKGKAFLSFSGPSFLNTCLEWVANKSGCFVVNIYSKRFLADKNRTGVSAKMRPKRLGHHLNEWQQLYIFSCLLKQTNRLFLGQPIN